MRRRVRQLDDEPGVEVPDDLFGLALGALAGSINGLITTRLQIQSFITTLAMLGVARGVASLWADGYAIPLAFGDGEGMARRLYKSLFAGELSILGLEVPAPVFYFLGVGLIAAFALQHAASAATSTPSAATPRRPGCRASTSTASG